MRTRPIGSIIGSVAGLTFVLVNAGAVPAPLLWRVAAVVCFVAVVRFAVLRGPAIEPVPPSRSAVRTYGISVTAMVLAIPVGAAVISNVWSRPDVVLPWVVFVVGAHFWPFARAFQLPVFRWLSASLIVISAVGAAAALGSDGAAAAGWTAVLAGFVLLFFSALGPRLSRVHAAAQRTEASA